jgi:hypothetical protein
MASSFENDRCLGGQGDSERGPRGWRIRWQGHTLVDDRVRVRAGRRAPQPRRQLRPAALAQHRRHRQTPTVPLRLRGMCKTILRHFLITREN